MSPIVANVIFPAFTTPYVSPFLFPIAGILAILTEFCCYRRLSDNEIEPSFGDIVGANLASWLLGVILGGILPSGLIQKSFGDGRLILGQGPNFTNYAIIAFFVACLLSILVEAGFLRWCRRDREGVMLEYLWLAGLANVCSYLVLGGLVAVFVHFGWFI